MISKNICFGILLFLFVNSSQAFATNLTINGNLRDWVPLLESGAAANVSSPGITAWNERFENPNYNITGMGLTLTEEGTGAGAYGYINLISPISTSGQVPGHDYWAANPGAFNFDIALGFDVENPDARGNAFEEQYRFGIDSGGTSFTSNGAVKVNVKDNVDWQTKHVIHDKNGNPVLFDPLPGWKINSGNVVAKAEFANTYHGLINDGKAIFQTLEFFVPLAAFSHLSLDDYQSITMSSSIISCLRDMENVTYRFNGEPVPEPTTLFLFGSGLLGAIRLRKPSKNSG